MMRYHIFLIEDDVYFDYFYKTDLLFEFLSEYMEEPSRIDLKKQFQYITCEIPHDEISYSEQSVYISDRIITVFADQESILDTQFISTLDKIDRHCFIINDSNNNYGWLKPNKNEFLWKKQFGVSLFAQTINQ